MSSHRSAQRDGVGLVDDVVEALLEVETSREVFRLDVVPVARSECETEGRLAVDVVAEIDRRRAVVDGVEGIA